MIDFVALLDLQSFLLDAASLAEAVLWQMTEKELREIIAEIEIVEQTGSLPA